MAQVEVQEPKVGEERIVLLPPSRRGRKHTLKRQVWARQGFTTFYDSGASDWVRWHGSWQELETLGRFDGRDDARAFMLKRSASLEAEAAG